MATKSDFAQKLLHDLRLRKEKMNATTHRHSTVAHGNSGQTSKTAPRINASESASRRSNGRSSSSRSVSTKDSSNQIILYDTSRQVPDLSMAIAFAFDNPANLANIGASSTNPFLNFFNRFGRRSSRKTQSLSTATVSHAHITQVSRGVHKLNQILRACSDGLSFDRNSIEVGKELLKGAIDLEEALRMLVNLQDGSHYTSSSHRIKLLDEDEDENDDSKPGDQWKLDRPTFSFDRRRRQLAISYTDEADPEQPNSKMVPHRRTASHVQDLSHFRQEKLSSNSCSAQEKGRISNVIAKLMGLEEIALNEDLKGRQGKVSRDLSSRESQNQNQNQTPPPPTANKKSNQTNTTPPIRESKVQLKPEKSRETIRKGDEQSQFFAANQNIADSKRKQSKSTENPRLGLNTELQKKPQKSKILKATRSIEQEVSTNVDKHFPSNQRRAAPIQEHSPKRADHSEDKRRAGQHFQKQNSTEKHNEESMIASKSKRSTATNGQKKLLRDKSEKLPPNRRQQDAAVSSDNNQKPAINQEHFKNEDQSKNVSTKALENDAESSDSVFRKEVPAAQKKAIPRKAQRREIPQKIDELLTKRNAAARTSKQAANMIKGLKQQMHNKNRSSKKVEEQSESKAEEGINVGNASEYMSEALKLNENDDDQTFNSNTTAADQNTHSLNDKDLQSGDLVLSSGDDLKRMDQSSALKDEELKQYDQSIDNEETTKPQNHGHTKQLERQEQLTEDEKHLKETLINSQLFLSTAEALFKLNIPLSFLHAAAADASSEARLVVDCAHEVMRRKSRRLEVGRKMIRTWSMDGLVKQLWRDLEKLKAYGRMNGGSIEECDVAAGLYEMLGKDIRNESPDVNCMWDFGGNVGVLGEVEDVVGDVEKHVLNGLLDDVTTDFLLVSVSA